jgi:hypothetical protein
MADLLQKYLLSSAAFQAPDSDTGAADGDEPQLDTEDDEEVVDPAGEPEDEGEDAGGVDDDAGDDVDAAGGEPRGRRQFGELRASNRELARHNAELTRRIAEAEGRIAGQQQYQPQETPAQRDSRLSLLSPEERLRVELQERDQFYAQRDRSTRELLYDSSDRASFAALQTTNAYAKRFASEVERQCNEFKAKGAFVDRAVILKQIIGDRVLNQKPRKRAAENRERQRARPVGAGSDVRATRSRAATGSAEDYETRFGDIPI